jgi:hypothetical protein
MKANNPKKETKNVKILAKSHRKLKMHVAKTGDNIVDYVSSLIDEGVKTKPNA